MKGEKEKEKEEVLKNVTDIDALKGNAEAAVFAFKERWVPVPSFRLGVEVMDERQLRNAMGLRATQDAGDPWHAVEQLLLELGFRWHWLGTSRVMYLMEKDGFVEDASWKDADEVECP